jgi:hypothetical protein
VQARSYICETLRKSRDPPRLGDLTPDVQSLLVNDCASSENLFLSAPVVLDDNPSWRALFDDGLLAPEDPILAQEPPSGAVAATAAVGRFGWPVNCAEPSPDGKWIAVLLDLMTVVLLPEALDYALSTALGIHFDDCVKMCGSAQPGTAMVNHVCVWESYLDVRSFVLPLNCAEPSPGGRWIAPLSDLMAVLLMSEAPA